MKQDFYEELKKNLDIEIEKVKQVCGKITKEDIEVSRVEVIRNFPHIRNLFETQEEYQNVLEMVLDYIDSIVPTGV